MNIHNKDTNQLTLNVLKLTRFMIKHGFYKNIEELKQISGPLVNLMNGVQDIYEVDNAFANADSGSPRGDTQDDDQAKSGGLHRSQTIMG